MRNCCRFIFFILIWTASFNVYAQSNTDSLGVCYSTYLGGESEDFIYSMKQGYDGSIYILGRTCSFNFPTTQNAAQSSFGGGFYSDQRYLGQMSGLPILSNLVYETEYDLFLTKLSGTGEIIYSTYFGGSGVEQIADMVVKEDGSVYIAVISNSSDFNVPIGVPQYSWGTSNSENKTVITKINPDGSCGYVTSINGLTFNTYGDNYNNFWLHEQKDAINNLHVSTTGKVYISGTTTNQFQVTPNAFQANSTATINAGYCVLSAQGFVEYATIIGGNHNQLTNTIHNNISSYLNNSEEFVLVGRTNSPSFPVSANAFQPNYQVNDNFVIKFNANNELVYSTYLGGTGDEGLNGRNFVALDDEGAAYIVGVTNSTNFPVTPNAFQTGLQNTSSLVQAGPSLTYDIFFTKFDPTGELLYSTYCGGANNDVPTRFKFSDNNLYISGFTNSTNFPVTTDPNSQHLFGTSDKAILVKFKNNGELVFSRIFGSNISSVSVNDISVAHNGDIFCAGTANSGLFTSAAAPQSDFVPTINPYNNWSLYNTCLFQFSGSGTQKFNSYWGHSGRAFVLADSTGAIHFARTTLDTVNLNSLSNNYFQVTQNAVQSANAFDASTNTIYVNNSQVLNPPQTLMGWRDVAYTIFRPLVTSDALDSLVNILYNDTLISCLNGPVQTIEGNPIGLSNSFWFPIFKWQFSSVDPVSASFDPDIDWQDIAFSNTQNFQPSTFTSNRWYRRLVFFDGPQTCDEVVNEPYLISASNVAFVMGSSNYSPQIEVGGNIFTCLNTSTTIGNNATITGGTAPYVVNWDFEMFLNNPNIISPTASVPASTVFTVEVIDANGCNNFDQMVLFAFPADAGENITRCPGDSVLIGSMPFIGEPATYSWSPSIDLSCVDCPMPFAYPSITTTYTLTKTITLPDGSTCSQTDNVVVTVPQNPNSVSDEIICYHPISNITSIGSPAQAGFNYSWFPQVWLEDPGVAQPIFNSENMFLHNTTAQNSNPMTYVRVATDGTCLWYDSLQLFMLRASNSFPTCGPTDLGYDWHPQIPASYEWSCLSGNCEFLGSQNTPSTTVGEPINGSALYQIEVCYEGVCCTSIFEVNSCEQPENLEQSPFCSLSVGLPTGCADLPLSLSASGVFSSPIMPIDQSLTQYTWFPAANFSNSNSPNTSLIINNEPYYLVLISNPTMPGEMCYQYFEIPLAIYPEFNPESGVLCSQGDEVTIGSQSVSFYNYFWEGPMNTAFGTSNPTVAIPGVYSYEVTNNISNCSISGEIEVLGFVFADAGEDQIVCPASNVQIGTPDPSNGQWQYSWYPYLAPWQEGTNENSPQPIVFAATDLNFTLTVFDSITGCLLIDDVNIIIDAQGPAVSLTDQFICSGDSVLLGPEPIYGALYNWFPSTGLSCTDCPNPIASPTSSTAYTVMIAFAGSCAPFIGEVNVFIADTSSLFYQDISKCPLNDVELNPQMIGACVNCTYSWFPVVGLNNPNILNPTSNANVDVQYTLTVTDAIGCERSGVVNLQITPTEVLILPDVLKCPGSSAPLNPQMIGACSGCTYFWSNGTNSPFVINPNTFVSSNAQATLTVTNPNGCLSSGTVDVIVSEPNYLPSQIVEVCESVSTPINPTMIGQCSGCTYLWTTPTGGYAGNTINLHVIANSNTYRVLKITHQGCQTIDTFYINVTPLITGVLPVVDKCELATVEINPNEIGACTGCTYLWQSPFSGTTPVPNNVINPNYSSPNNVTATLTVTPPLGCPEKYTVNFNILPPEPIDIEPVLRCDDNALVSINPFLEGACLGCTYAWTPSAGLTSTTAINPQTFFSNVIYTLTVTKPDGCKEVGNVHVNNFPPTDMPPSISICSSSTALIGPSNYLPSSTFSWSPATGLSDPNSPQTLFTPPGIGSYEFTLSEERQVGPNQYCTIVNTIFVYVDGVDLSELNNHLNICQNTCEPIGLNTQNGVSYYWSPSQDLSCNNCSDPLVCAVEDQTYQLTAIQNVSGCMYQASVTVNVFDIPLPQVDIPDILVCEQSLVSLPLEIDPPGQYAYNWSPANLVSNPNSQNPSVNIANLNTPSTQFTVNITDLMTGCSGILDTAWIHVGIVDDIHISVLACEEYIAPDGTVYNNSQIVTYLLENSTGCDSLVTLNITIGFPSENDVFVSTCVPYEWAGNLFDISGVYVHNFISSTGCDSLVALHLTMENIVTSEQELSACDSFLWAVNGNSYNSSGVYYHEVANPIGCDSLFVLYLTVNSSTTEEIEVDACDSYIWPLTGITYTESGYYSITFLSSMDCDSTIVLNLTIKQSSNTEIFETACKSYTWPLSSMTYTESGSYDVLLQNSAGCDSLITLNLQITDFYVEAISTDQTSLTASLGESFQWVVCPTMESIPLANNQTFVASENGAYAVIATDAIGCVDTSYCVDITSVGLGNDKLAFSRIYPNPTFDQVTIEFNDVFAEVELYEAQGKLVKSAQIQSGNQFSLSHEQSGVYFVRIISKSGVFMHRIIKQQ